MGAAKTGDNVQVHYTGRLIDGTEFDSSRGGEPLGFKLGEGQVIQGFDNAVTGMETGDTKKFTIPADEAYGEHKDDLVQTVERGAIPGDIDLKEGMQLRAMANDDKPVIVTVVGYDEEKVTLDANHPLAGKDLEFEVEVVAIEG